MTRREGGGVAPTVPAGRAGLLPDALPPYTVRVSARARRVSLRVNARDGLVVTLPRGARPKDAEAAVRSKRDWAVRALAGVAHRRALVEAGPDAWLPDVVCFPAFGESWPVEYRSSAAQGVQARMDGGRIVVIGNVDDAGACVRALSRRLDSLARERLVPLTWALAAEHGFTCTAVSVRRQRSRWGSCSHAGRISLNRALVFLPEPLVRYVLMHELAHTKRLDHSPAFWRELARVLHDAPRLRRELKRAGDLVPVWAEVEAPIDAE